VSISKGRRADPAGWRQISGRSCQSLVRFARTKSVTKSDEQRFPCLFGGLCQTAKEEEEGTGEDENAKVSFVLGMSMYVFFLISVVLFPSVLCSLLVVLVKLEYEEGEREQQNFQLHCTYVPFSASSWLWSCAAF